MDFEKFTTQRPELSREQRLEQRNELRELARELEGVTFIWPGLTPDAYRKLKRDEEEFPEYCNPIDDVIGRCEAEGVKIVIINTSVSVLPAESGDSSLDILYPHSLQVTASMDGAIAELIHRSRQLKR